MKKLFLMITCATLLCACGGPASKPTEEAKTLPSSTMVMKGKHAKLFKLAKDDYQVSLVQTNNGWQVRVKMTIANQTAYEDIKNYKSFQNELQGVYGSLINSSDVEVESLHMNESDWDDLLQEEVGTEAVVSGRTWDYKSFSYEAAKAIYDKTVGVQISGLELKEAKKGKASKIVDEETQETINDMKEILEAEGEMLNALKGLF